MNRCKKYCWYGKRRSSSGYALVAVMCVSIFATLMLLALSDLAVSLMRTQGVARERSYALQAAEIGIDYARTQLTDSLQSGVISSVEPTNSASEKLSDLPPEYIPEASVLTKVRIRVKRIAPSDLADMQFYPDIQASSNFLPAPSEEQSPTWNFGDDWYSAAQKLDQSYFWIIESTAHRGVFVASVRTMLRPAQIVDSDYLDTGSSDKYKNSFFPNVVVTNLDAQLTNENGGNVSVRPVDGNQVEATDTNRDYTATIQSNGMVSLSNLSNILGNLSVTNPPTEGTVVTGNPQRIWGRVTANSGVDQTILTSTNGQNPSSTDTVVGAADDSNIDPNSKTVPVIDRFKLNQNPVTVNSTDPQNSFSPLQVPTAVDASTFPASTSDSSGQSQDIVPMDYRASSLSTPTSSPKIVVNPSNYESPQPTRVFLDANSNIQTAVDINSARFENQGQPTDFQIYYGGDKPVNIVLSNGGSFKGVIYAPRTTVTTSGNGSFIGAVVANRFNATHTGDLQLDPRARAIAPAGLNTNSNNNSSNVNTSRMRKPSGYVAATWQQIPGVLVPLE